ncbi:DUF1501 domain-containing protein [Chloroflexi bacterium TSY]|nr:DUF1501 domain-containing protein [Chloroflexi bacterium TSY]
MDLLRPDNGAAYPNNSFGRNLQAVAQMVKLQLGMRVATIDLGGWDTHDSQGEDGGGYFFNHLQSLATGLKAFHTDLSNNPNGSDNGRRITTVVMSEFGRSLKENGSRGTDHGHGNVMFVLGDQVKGGKVHGEWPGLGPDRLYDNRDLAINTDYRRVLSEILIRRMTNPNLGIIFPGYTGYEPLDIVAGADLEPNYNPAEVTPTPTSNPEATPTSTPTRWPGTVINPPTPTPVPTDPQMPTPTSTPAPTSTPPVNQNPDELDERVYIPIVKR